MGASRPRRSPRRPPRAVLILAAFPRRAAAERAARLLVRERHLACVTLTPNARAIYRWKGKEVREASVLLLGKTTRPRARGAVRALAAVHPDQVPEILILEVAGGHAPYLAWLGEEVATKR